MPATSDDPVDTPPADPPTSVLDGRHTMVLVEPELVLNQQHFLAEVTMRPSLRPRRRIRLAAESGALRMPALGVVPELYLEFGLAQAEPRPWSRRNSAAEADADPLTLSCGDLERTHRNLIKVRGEFAMGELPVRGFRGTMRIVESTKDYVLGSLTGQVEGAPSRPADASRSALAEVMFGPRPTLEFAMEFTR